MSNWLYQEVLTEDDHRAPKFSQVATTNWMRALSFEIIQEHGEKPVDQYNSCLKHFKSSYQKLSPLENLAIFEPMFACLTYAQTLTSHSHVYIEEAWIAPSAIVSWYYCWYTAIRAISAVTGQPVADNHTAVYKAYVNSLRAKMPHPLNMQASHQKNEKYSIELPSLPSSSIFDLQAPFPNTREAAQGMLIQYLKGCSQYYADLTKERILKKGTHENFRTTAAKAERNKHLDKCVSFMHCAFRYRGKANYRDAIYLNYGQSNSFDSREFLTDLATSSQFAFLLTLSLVSRSPLHVEAKKFIDDISLNLRGIDKIAPENKFWNVL